MGRNAILLLTVLLLGCGGGGGGSGGGPGDESGAPLLLAAGTTGIDPVDPELWVQALDLARFGVAGVDAVYDLTTPAGEAFSFDLLSRGPQNRGAVRVSLAHLLDDGAPPAGGLGSIADVGVVPSAAGVTSRGDWLDATGDGFARITIRGAIERDQVFLVQSEAGGGGEAAAVRVRIGPVSEVNLAARPGTDYPGLLSTAALYSSDSWRFGIPTVAVSGDRTSVVCYEGDLLDPDGFARFEMRLQHDRLSGAVTGGASEETTEDTGNWRDHEIAALFNVLALVHSGAGQVALKLSFDRGATFAQSVSLGGAATTWRPRLAQIAIAADYTLAVAWWSSDEDGASALMAVTGRPASFDGTGSPTSYEFDPPFLVHRVAGDVTPMLFGIAWSDGGDLVIGYSFTSFTVGVDGTWTSLTRSRCAVRPFGGVFTDTLVEEDLVVGRDPSVAVTGSGDSLRVFYAYEARDGVRLRTSDDGGRTFGAPMSLDDPAASVPSVFAREQGGPTRVDLLFLTQGVEGTELHLRHWDDFDAGPFSDHRLTTAEMVESATLPRNGKVPGADAGAFVPDQGFRITQVAWFGYDATLDGDDLVVVVDEETFDAWTICVGAPFLEGGGGPPGAQADGAAFAPAEPPPLAPGLTEPLPVPDPVHMHQLRLFRLD